MAALRKQNRTKQIQLQKLQIAHSRQKNVLKRKMEEAASVRARSELHKLKRQNAETLRARYAGKSRNTLKVVVETFLKKYGENQDLKQNLSHEVAARASLTKKMKRFSDRAVMGAATKSGNYEVALQYTAPRIASLNQKLTELNFEDTGVAKVWEHVRSITDAKLFIEQAISALEDTIKLEKKAKYDCSKMRAKYTDIKSKFGNVQREKEVLAANFEEKLLTIQNDHEEHMALILEEVKIPPSKTTTGTAMTPKANRENVKVPNDTEYYAYESFSDTESPKHSVNPSNVTKECIKQDISLSSQSICHRKPQMSTTATNFAILHDQDPVNVPPAPSTKHLSKIQMPSLDELKIAMKSTGKEEH